jgi:hypothetical protein
LHWIDRRRKDLRAYLDVGKDEWSQLETLDILSVLAPDLLYEAMHAAGAPLPLKNAIKVNLARRDFANAYLVYEQMRLNQHYGTVSDLTLLESTLLMAQWYRYLTGF